MKILILGVGDAFTKTSFGTSALIQSPEGFLLLDCPDPIHRVLHEATSGAGWNVDALGIRDVLITHLHGDHSNGLESFGFWNSIHRRNNPDHPRPRLHTHQPAADRLWEKLAPAMDAPGQDGASRTLSDFYEPHIIDPDHPATIAGLTVRSRFTGHPIPTIGIKISDGSFTLGWSSDTPFEEAHIDWLSDADVIVHECNVGAAHTPVEQLNALPDELRKKMCLIHLPDDFEPAGTDMRILKPGEVLGT